MSRPSRVLKAFLLLVMVPAVTAHSEQNCTQAASVIRDAARQLGDDKDSGKALSAYSQAADLCPTMAEAHYNKGVLLVKNKEYDAGITSLQRAYEIKQQPQFQAAIGTALLEQGKLPEAREQFEKVLQSEPQSVKALQGLSVISQRQGDEDRALSLLEKARSAAPQDVVTLFNLGVLKEKKGMFADAKSLYEQAVEIDPRNERAATRLAAICLQQGEPAEAQRLVSRVLELNPKSLDALKLNAALQSETAEQGRAILSLKRALEVEPKNEQTVVSLATLLLDQNSSEEALTVLQQSAANIPETTEIAQLIGQAQMALGNLTDAEAAFKRALNLNALDSEAHYNYAVLLERLGRNDEAKEHRETAKKLNPDVSGQ